jgi:TolB-like protein/Tfp pilus assembly protein PilF
MKIENFFGELKRRNVYKVAVAYAIVGWLVVQIATQVFPFFEIPNWAVRLVIALVVIGFLIALVIAWAFEATPEGIKRTETADAMPATSGHKKHAWVYIVVIGAAISVVLFFLVRYTAGNKAASSPNHISNKSIAVLPFENLSRDPDNAYFADGIQEEILARLSKIADLKVISRTSTKKYKSNPNNLREIAQQLGVANILEGSVQKSADQVRVNVQLINATKDAHLWGEIYDRKLTDVFAVESDIAKTIAETLRVRFSGAEQSAIAVRPTENTDAHELYLKGRYFLSGRRNGDDLKRAIDYFNQAIAKDPNYALAYAGLADSYTLLPGWSDQSQADCFAKARWAASKALELDNNLAEAHTSLAILLFADGNLREAKREFERAISLNPNYAAAHYFFGLNVLASLGRFDAAIAEIKRAIELDPFSLIMNTNLGHCYSLARRYPEAIVQLRKVIDVNPDFAQAHLLLGEALELSGEIEQAITEYERAHDLAQHVATSASSTWMPAHIYDLKGERDKALQLLNQLKEADRNISPTGLAFLYLHLGDKKQAIDLLERGYQNKEFDMIATIKVNPWLDSLRGDPRFEKLANQIVPPDLK